MEISEAREIIEALASGVNPITGEVFEKSNCFNEPDIIRALYVAKDQLIKAEKKSTRKLPENAGKPWTDADDKKLKELCAEGKNLKEISAYFKRTRGAIQSRINQLATYQKIF